MGRLAASTPGRERRHGRWLRRFAERMAWSEAGSIAIETALSFMLVMTCVLGVIECCYATYTYAVYADAARYGVRYATFHGTDSSNCSGPSTGCGDPTGANVVNQVKSYAVTYTPAIPSASVQVSYPDGSSASPSRVIVSISYTYIPLFKTPLKNLNFYAVSEGRIIY